jgi:thioesterase domain-containing protein
MADEETAAPSPDRPKPKKAAPRSRALSVETLEQLGARRLAELLMVQAKGDAALARTLRLALAGMDGGGRLAAEVEKRLRTIGRSRGFIEWDKVRPLARELDSLRETIAGPLAATDPRAAVAQMRLLLGLADNVFERSDDGSGTLGEVFRQAGADLGRLWARLPHRDPAALAGEVLALWDADGYGETDRLLEAAGPALGPEGRAELRRLLQVRLAALPRARKPDAFESWQGRGQITFRLRDLADLEGDVDAYIAATEAGGLAENFAGDVAERLIAHGRPGEALAWLDRAPGQHESEEVRHADLRIAALDALGRREEAQALRWEAFCRWLTPQHLRPYLRGLPDFDDMEAEDRAMAHALAHPDRNLALSFLAGWPNLEAANRLVRAHHSEMDGRDYGRLRPAAEALAERYPAAATLLHRTLAEDVLRRASSRQYQYAVRDVRSCASLAPLLSAETGLENHDMFLARLRREHGRKAGFWALMEGRV